MSWSDFTSSSKALVQFLIFFPNLWLLFCGNEDISWAGVEQGTQMYSPVLGNGWGCTQLGVLCVLHGNMRASPMASLWSQHTCRKKEAALLQTPLHTKYSIILHFCVTGSSLQSKFWALSVVHGFLCWNFLLISKIPALPKNWQSSACPRYLNFCQTVHLVPSLHNALYSRACLIRHHCLGNGICLLPWQAFDSISPPFLLFPRHKLSP